MAAKCPHCGKTLRWYNFRAECKHCGVNIPNYNWEQRLEEDSEKAETAFAKLHYRVANFKSGTVGNPFRIIRLVLSLIPLVALVVPLVKISLSLPFYEKNESISFLTLILNYITKIDFMGGFKLMGATALGSTVTPLMIMVVLMFLAVAAGVLNFFLTLIGTINLKAGINVVLNFIATAGWTGAAVMASKFVLAAADGTINVLEGSVVWWGFAVGIALFAINTVINIITARSFKKQLASQPSLEQFIENELEENRKTEAAEDTSEETEEAAEETTEE